MHRHAAIDRLASPREFRVPAYAFAGPEDRRTSQPALSQTSSLTQKTRGLRPVAQKETSPCEAAYRAGPGHPLPKLCKLNRCPYTNEETCPAQQLEARGTSQYGSAFPIRGFPCSLPIQCTGRLPQKRHPVSSPPTQSPHFPRRRQRFPLPPRPTPPRLKHWPAPRPATTRPSPNFTLSTKDASTPYVCAWWGISLKPKT